MWKPERVKAFKQRWWQARKIRRKMSVVPDNDAYAQCQSWCGFPSSMPDHHFQCNDQQARWSKRLAAKSVIDERAAPWLPGAVETSDPDDAATLPRLFPHAPCPAQEQPT